MDTRQRRPSIKVAIVGAGISGLAVANGLLTDSFGRFDVQIYERDTIAFDSERGGYQIRIAANGLEGLKTVANEALWAELQTVWAGDESRAPALVEPRHFKTVLDLSKYSAYPSSRPVPRIGLRKALLKRPLAENRVHFNHKFQKYEKVDTDGRHLLLHFKDAKSVTADILIACDGSNSQVNKQVGLNNKIKLQSQLLIQARASIDEITRSKLPSSLLEHGSLLFLGGRCATGFCSIYAPEHPKDGKSEPVWNLFWSILVPNDVGERIMKASGHDDALLICCLLDYLHEELHYGPSLSTVINAGTTYLRTGRLTSSVRHGEDWRRSIPENSRIILLGDAVHPMTPGRGQGANQALTDSGKLVRLLTDPAFGRGGGSLESDLTKLTKTFDSEMYDRAFDMVKKSEQVTDLDLTTVKGRCIAFVVGAVMRTAGWWMGLMELIGLQKKEDFDFKTLHK